MNEGQEDRPAKAILVTGATGFLGSYIIKTLIDHNIRVRAIKRSPTLPFWIPQETLDLVEWVEGEILDPVSLYDAMQNVDTVIHSAAVVSFSKKNRALMYQVNIEGTANVVNVALEAGVKKLIHISSIAALGRTKEEELVTEKKKWEKNRNNTHYAITKHEAEMHVWRGFAEGLNGVILNPSTILGYGNWNHSSCTLFKNIHQGFNWYSTGINGFVGVEDVAEATRKVLLSDINHQRFIVSAENWQFRKLFNTIADHFQRQHPSHEATPFLGSVAWRLESLKSFLTGKPASLTRETAKVAQSKTSFDGSALQNTLSGFNYTPLETVIARACTQYKRAIETGLIK